MSIRFDNRVAIVTGAGGGLGRAHALLLAKCGAKVVVNDPGGAVDGGGGDRSVADKVVAEIRAAGGHAVASYDSVATFEGAQQIIGTAVKTFGTVDILINNAGILRDKSFSKMEMSDFALVLQIHLMGTVYCTKAAWPIMMEKKYGRIVVTTSGAGLMGNFGQANYATAKMGMIGFQNALKIEGEKHNIRINAISPSANTRMIPATDPQTMKLSKPELVSPAVAWLCSEECHVSGQIIGAGAGYFCAIHYWRSEGVMLDPTREVTVDEFAGSAAEVLDFSKAVEFQGVGRLSRRLLAERGYIKAE